MKKGDKVRCSCLNKTGGIVREVKPFDWLYNVWVEFPQDGTISKYTQDGRFSVEGEICLQPDNFKIGDILYDTKGRFKPKLKLCTVEVVDIDLSSDFPLKVSDGRARRSYTLDGRYDYNGAVELITRY